MKTRLLRSNELIRFWNFYSVALSSYAFSSLFFLYCRIYYTFYYLSGLCVPIRRGQWVQYSQLINIIFSYNFQFYPSYVQEELRKYQSIVYWISYTALYIKFTSPSFNCNSHESRTQYPSNVINPRLM